MKLSELFEAVDLDPNLEGVGFEDTDRGTMLLVKHLPSHLITRLPMLAVEDLAWGALMPVLYGDREPRVLEHMSRVVGYYSRIENWNESKIGELRDRHKGNYAVVEQE